MPPPKAFVTVNPTTNALTKHLISGSIYPIYKNGSLAAVLNESREGKTRIPLNRKVKWCFQLASVLHHVHSVARSWHQDFKPPNMLLDDADGILVIDWEKCGANSFILAPEANGRFDIEEDTEETSGHRKLRYKAYNGPERVNDPIAVPKWNVFPGWNKEYPEAVELAEIYSLGKTIWLILEQVSTGYGGEDYSSEVVQWSEWSEDIPQSWKDIVDRCIKVDPNARIRMEDLCRFWEDELIKHG
jgi:serine/threonine protein kinase